MTSSSSYAVNLTEAMMRACDALNKAGHFNGSEVLNASCESEQTKLETAVMDELSAEETERYIRDYACVNFHIDTYVEQPDRDYVSTGFDEITLQKDFREWLLEFVGGDESVLPDKIDLRGGDTEITRRRD